MVKEKCEVCGKTLSKDVLKVYDECYDNTPCFCNVALLIIKLRKEIDELKAER